MNARQSIIIQHIEAAEQFGVPSWFRHEETSESTVGRADDRAAHDWAHLKSTAA